MSDENKFDKIETKIDNISDDITEIKVIMARNTSSLEEHMRRSLANEQAVEILKEEFKPVQVHVLKVEGVTSFLIILAKILGGIVAAISIIGAIVASLSN